MALGVCEIILRAFRPSRLVGVGTDRVAKAQDYGWFFPANEPIDFIHPDTGRVFSEDRTNSEGWNDAERTKTKPPGVFRILFVGDSVTFGVVRRADLYTRQCERLLHEQGYANVEIISMGVGGWGTDQSLEALRREGVAYDPDLVIYQFCGNDVTDNLQPTPTTPAHSIFQKKPFRYEIEQDGLIRRDRHVQRRQLPLSIRLKQWLLKSALAWNLNQMRHAFFHLEERPWERQDAAHAVYTNEQGEVLSRNIPASRPDDWWASRKPNPDSAYFPYRYGPEPEALRDAWRLLELLILEMKALCEQNDAHFAVFSEESEEGKREYVLSWGCFHSDADGDFVRHEGERVPVNWKRYEQNLREICARHRIPLIAPKRKYERYQYDPHANAAGNLAMAHDIAEFLIAADMLPSAEARAATAIHDSP